MNFFGRDQASGATETVVKKEYIEIYAVRMNGDESVISRNKRFLTVIAKKIGANSKANLLAFYQSELSSAHRCLGNGSSVILWTFENEQFLCDQNSKIEIEVLWSDKQKKNYLSSSSDQFNIIGKTGQLSTASIADRYTVEYPLSLINESKNQSRFYLTLRRRAVSMNRVRQIVKGHIPLPTSMNNHRGFLVPPSLGKRKKHSIEDVVDDNDLLESVERPERPDLALPNSLLSIGQLEVIVWHGRKVSSANPLYLTVELPGSNYGSRHRSQVSHNSHSPIFDFCVSFDIFSIQQDLSIMIWEETAVGPNFILGRVTIPLHFFLDAILSEEDTNPANPSVFKEGKAKELLKHYVNLENLPWFGSSGNSSASFSKKHDESNTFFKNQHSSMGRRKSSAWEITSSFISGDSDKWQRDDLETASSSFSKGAYGQESEDYRPLHVEREADGTLRMRHWFEILQRPQKKHRGGQYRPADAKLPLYSNMGYGIAKFDPPLGFLKIEISLKLYKSFTQTLIDNPWSYGPCSWKEDKMEDAGIWDLVVAADSLFRIYKLVTSSPLARTVYSILHWQAPPVLCILAFYTLAYVLLAAPLWQIPCLCFALFLLLGIYTGSIIQEEPLCMYSLTAVQSQSKSQEKQQRTRFGTDRPSKASISSTGTLATTADRYRLLGKTNTNGVDDVFEIYEHGDNEKDKDDVDEDDDVNVDIGVDEDEDEDEDEDDNEDEVDYDDDGIGKGAKNKPNGKLKRKVGVFSGFGLSGSGKKVTGNMNTVQEGKVTDEVVASKLAENISKSSRAGFFEGFKIVKSNAYKMQVIMNATRSLLERINNLIIWKDYVASSTATYLGLLLSLLLSVTLSVISLRQMLFGVLVGVFTSELHFPVNDTQKFIRNRVKYYFSGVSKFDEKEMSILMQHHDYGILGKGGGGGGVEEEGEDDGRLNYQGNSAAKRIGETRGLISLFVSICTLWLDVVPDDLDIIHRRICREAVVTLSEEGNRLNTKKNPLDFQMNELLFAGQKSSNFARFTGCSLLTDKRLETDSGTTDQKFTIRVNVVSASGLELTPQSSLTLAPLLQKVYCDAAILPLGSTTYTCRSGGQLRNTDIVFREEFTFTEVKATAKAIVVAITCKSPAQMKTDSAIIGYIVISLHEYLDACEKAAKRYGTPMKLIEITSTYALYDALVEGHTKGSVNAALLIEYAH